MGKRQRNQCQMSSKSCVLSSKSEPDGGGPETWLFKSRNADLRPHKKPEDCKKAEHFFLGHLNTPRAPLSTAEWRGMFVGTPGMIVVRYERISGGLRAL